MRVSELPQATKHVLHFQLGLGSLPAGGHVPAGVSPQGPKSTPSAAHRVHISGFWPSPSRERTSSATACTRPNNGTPCARATRSNPSRDARARGRGGKLPIPAGDEPATKKETTRAAPARAPWPRSTPHGLPLVARHRRLVRDRSMRSRLAEERGAWPRCEQFLNRNRNVRLVDWVAMHAAHDYASK
jgi:hypothetical protein